MASEQVAHDHEDHPTGWRRYVYSTNHKDIGNMYLVFAIIAGIIGGAMSVVLRMELQSPGDDVLGGNYHLYNVLVTGHGLIMIFFMVMPAMIMSCVVMIGFLFQLRIVRSLTFTSTSRDQQNR